VIIDLSDARSEHVVWYISKAQLIQKV